MDDENCGKCKFFRRHVTNINEGFCKRLPPVVIIAPIKDKSGVMSPRPVSASPNMHQSDWCGEFKMKVSLQ